LIGEKALLAPGVATNLSRDPLANWKLAAAANLNGEPLREQAET